MPENEEFKLVTRRKKRVPHVRNNHHSSLSLSVNDKNNDDSSINYEILLGKLHEAGNELKNSAFADNVFHYLKDSLSVLNVSGISDILCYGLGNFSNRKSSKYQLALLLSLKKHYGSQVYLYDPVFSSREIELLKGLGCNIIEVNEEGKHVIHDNITLRLL
ncbi:SRR1-like protein isoform X2 [Xylocopa sonorina]|uniref:SRR1-like protein isoform X2 n=1 Tax=Xylocopa sonorina TaxID=1818115 RepID=UPI00403B26C0